MKLIKNTKLYFKQGTSDKVYEVDLCDTGDSLYVVNFRYGRRDGNLKDGTKTVFPVSYDEAVKIFDKLVESKTKKGYTESQTSLDGDVISDRIDYSKRDELIVKYLKEYLSKTYRGNWSLSRIIWRAAELKLTEAAEFIIQFLKHDGEFVQHNSAYYFGRISDESYTDELRSIYTDDDKLPENRVILSSLVNISLNYSNKDVFVRLLDKLPYVFRQSVENRNSDEFERIFNDQLFVIKSTENMYVWYCYLLSHHYTFIRTTIINTIKNIPFKSNYFKYIRYIYKSAELFDDYEVLGILTHRFSKVKSEYQPGSYVYNGDDYVHVRDEIVKENSTIAYLGNTRNYFNNRCLRNLIKKAHNFPNEYPNLATEILLSFNDEFDKGKIKREGRYDYDTEAGGYHYKEVISDEFSDYNIFNYILYKNSERLHLPSRNAKRWIYKGEHSPENDEPTTREEAFSELWNSSSENIIRLLQESKCEKVHIFANKVLKDNDYFISDISIDTVLNLLNSEYEVTKSSGIELAERFYDKDNPSVELITKLLASKLQRGREISLACIKFGDDSLRNNPDVIAALISSVYDDIRAWALIHIAIPSADLQNDIAINVINCIIELECEDVDKITYSIGDLLLKFCPEFIQKLSETDIEKMIVPEKPHLMVLAGTLVRGADNSEYIFAKYLTQFLNSDNETVRKVGFNVFESYSDKSLLNRATLIANMSISQLSDVRKAVQPIIGRLVVLNSEFAESLVRNFLAIFYSKEEYDGLHEDVYRIFTESLNQYLNKISKTQVLKLLKSKYEFPQKLGMLIFKRHLNLNDFEMSEIVSLADSDVAEMRELCRSYFSKEVARVRYEKESAVKILNSGWKDTRDFAFEFFDKHYTRDDWDSDMLIYVCDSVREDVQLFGRKMVVKFFDEKNAGEYLQKLSQHPTQNMQLFVSTFIEKHAKENADTILYMEYFFKAVLMQVNRGRVIKDRVLKFLENEAQKDINVAKMVMRILNDVSLTNVIKDKSRFIEIMIAIKSRFNDVESVLVTNEFQTK